MYDDDYEIIENLSDTEILELCGQLPPNDKVRQIIQRAQEQEGLEILCDEAYAIYWQKRLKTMSILNENTVVTLLELPETATARSFLGDAAQLNKLSPLHINFILAHISPGGWVYKQVLAKCLVNRFSERITNTVDVKDDFEETISSLIELKTTWAILDIIPLLTHNELTIVFGLMQSTTILNRHARHEIREAIKRAEKRLQKGVGSQKYDSADGTVEKE